MSPDEDYDDWKPGDLVAWEDEPGATPMRITGIDRWQRVFWSGQDGESMTRATNLVRVQKGTAAADG